MDQQAFFMEQARHEGERKGLAEGSRIERARCAGLIQSAIDSGTVDLASLLQAIETGAPSVSDDIRTSPQSAVAQALQAGKSRQELLADEVDRLCGRSPAATDVINAALDGDEDRRMGYPSARPQRATDTINAALDLDVNDVVFALDADDRTVPARDPFPHLSAEHREKLADAIDRESPPAGDVVEARR